MSERNNTKLVVDTLLMAVARRGNLKNLIIHSDQGSTYASSIYQQLLKKIRSALQYES